MNHNIDGEKCQVVEYFSLVRSNLVNFRIILSNEIDGENYEMDGVKHKIHEVKHKIDGGNHVK